MMQEKEMVFVRVDEPLHLRKSIIKLIIDLEELKKNELNIKGIRKNKHKELGKLKNLIGSIHERINFLDGGVLPNKEKAVESHLKEIEKKPPVKKKPKKSLSELEKLKLELNNIDDKLNELEF